MTLSIKNLEVTYHLNKFTSIYAVNDISFELNPGDVIGIIGETGSGKTTIANTIMRALPDTATVKGSIILDDKDLLKMKYKEFRKKIAWKKISIIPQYSMNSLNPIKRIGDQLVRILQEHEDISKEDAISRILDLFKQVNLSEDILLKYPDELSGGQRQRVVIVSALMLNPEVIIADEPTTALDVINQARVINLLKEKVINQNRIVMYITHDIAVVAGLANKIMTLYGGKIMEIGDIKEIFKEPLNPYTKGLLDSVPKIDNGRPTKVSYIPGDPVNQTEKPKGCPFYPRCPLAMDVCKESFPEGVKVGNRIVYCHAVSKK